MNIKRLDVEMNRAQVLLQALKTRAAEQKAKVKEAKAKARVAKQGYKQRRKAAKQAKRLLLDIEESLERQERVAAKAKKRYAKALKRASATIGAGKPGSPRVSPRKQAKQVPTAFPVATNYHRKRPQPAKSPKAPPTPLVAGTAPG